MINHPNRSKSAATRGPWRVKESRRPGQSIAICKGETAVELAYVPHHGKFSEANARLIAAAPDLLFALKVTLELLGCTVAEDEAAKPEFKADVAQAQAAIAKAGA